MADNITTNPGTGGDTLAADDIGGVKFPRTKLVIGADGVNGGDVSAANPLPTTGLTDAELRASPLDSAPLYEAAAYWPAYKAPSGTAQRRASVDEGGALVTRGAVTTDEGTFRVNFANTSIAVGIGSVSRSGRVITGSGFAAADVHEADYFKFDADPDTSWMQIESIDSDTQLTLAGDYTGATSGAASRSLVFVNMQNGATYGVASGQFTLTSGTTSGASGIVGRVVDYAPLVFRCAVSISQRIANQETRIGFAEPVTAGAPRWFARFKADGTTNTSIICESGRNPTGAPSAAETQTTTATLPNAATTAAMNDYRVEILTESVRFYINKVLVAEHVRVLPSQSDIMAASVRIVNTAAAGSSTSVVVDYMTTKNHNKLEVGIMSDSEQIVAQQPDLVPYTYNVAGVIAINTILLTIDCSRLRSLSIHALSIGTTGVVTPEWSNDPTAATWPGATLSTPAGGSATTFNAAGMWTTPVLARYFRLRLTTATTAGTTTLSVVGSSLGGGFLPTQPVSGTLTANIGTGSLAAGTNAIGDVGIQYRANATGAASALNVVSAATANPTVVKASAGRLLGFVLTNNATAVRYVKFHNQTTAPTAGTGVVQSYGIPPNGGTIALSIPGGVGFATGIGMTIVTGAAATDATAVALNDVVGTLHFA